MVMLIKKIGLIVLALLFSADIALAESGYKHKQHRKPQYHGHVNPPKRYPPKNYYHGGNRYYRGDTYNYYNNRNNNWYNNPYFWGGVAGGLIGGAIIRDYQYEPECQTIWTDVYVPGEGYRNVQRVVCD